MMQIRNWLPAFLLVGGLLCPAPVAAQLAYDSEPVRLPSIEVEHDIWTFAPQTATPEPTVLMDPDVVLNEPKSPPIDLGGLGKRAMFGGQNIPGYGATWYPGKLVKGQDVDFQLVRETASATLPIWGSDDALLLFSVNVRDSQFFTDAVLPDTQRPFPEELWRVNLGLNYVQQLEDGSSLVMLGGIGSASDKPFHDWKEMNVTLGTFWRRPARNDRNAWILGVMYSPAGTLNFPIPLVAYQWNPSESFQMSLGIPLSVRWHPFGWENWVVNFSYLPLTNGSLMTTHDFTPTIHLYSGYQSISNAYFLSDRQIAADRFYTSELRLVKGLRWDIGPSSVLDVCVGYAFDRKYGEGANFGASLHDEVDVQPGEFLEARWQVRF